MGANRVTLEDVRAVGGAVQAAMAEFPPVLMPFGWAKPVLTDDGVRLVGAALLLDGGAPVRRALRHALLADLRVYRDGPAWWVAECRVCGHEECAPRHPEALGLAHVHRLECTGDRAVLRGETCG
jgi:hypothetical protein